MSIFDTAAAKQPVETPSPRTGGTPPLALDVTTLDIGTDATITLKRANRHGLVAGATGTGKTVTLHRMAECFSAAGVPVFAVDVKGDLASIATGNPATPIDILGQSGVPVRTTITEFGPTLLSRLLDLNDVQSGVLNVLFRVADAEGLILTDLKDFRAMLQYMLDNTAEISREHGLISTASIAAIQRALMELENQGADAFFGEPAFDAKDLIQTNNEGRGVISLLAADQLLQRPALYASFLLWLLSELFEDLPEVGDPAKPKLVLFFDEAHLLFKDTPDALVDTIEQVVRLIRSKGVGVYFVTQNPADIPSTVLGQLGNRVQHALRAFTPADQKGVKAAADTFRANPDFDTKEAITNLGVGEALVSTLDASGTPSMVIRTKIHLPVSSLGPIDAGLRQSLIENSAIYSRYAKAVDGESAFERLQSRSKTEDVPTKKEKEEPDEKPRARKSASSGQSLGEAVLKSAVRAAGSQVGRQIAGKLLRGVLGSVLR